MTSISHRQDTITRQQISYFKKIIISNTHLATWWRTKLDNLFNQLLFVQEKGSRVWVYSICRSPDSTPVLMMTWNIISFTDSIHHNSHIKNNYFFWNHSPFTHQLPSAAADSITISTWPESKLSVKQDDLTWHTISIRGQTGSPDAAAGYQRRGSRIYTRQISRYREYTRLTLLVIAIRCQKTTCIRIW